MCMFKAPTQLSVILDSNADWLISAGQWEDPEGMAGLFVSGTMIWQPLFHLHSCNKNAVACESCSGMKRPSKQDSICKLRWTIPRVNVWSALSLALYKSRKPTTSCDSSCCMVSPRRSPVIAYLSSGNFFVRNTEPSDSSVMMWVQCRTVTVLGM